MIVLLCYCVADCGYPTLQVDSPPAVMGYNVPAREGTTITFSCSPGLILTGPNTTICMDNGQWEPGPGQVKCNGQLFD